MTITRRYFWILAAALAVISHDGAHSQPPTPVPSLSGFIDGETPSGLIDGKNRVFRLASVPVPLSSLHLYRNGIRQRVEADYALSSTGVIIFISYPFLGPIPAIGDKLTADYRK